jgi:hypothetical protein
MAMRRGAGAAGLLAAWLVFGALACRRVDAPAGGAQATAVAPDGAAPVDPEVEETARLVTRMAGVLRCFQREMRARAGQDPALSSYRGNLYTEVFVWGAVVRDPSWVNEREEPLCRRVLDEYRRLYLDAAGKRPRRSAAAAEAKGLLPQAIDSYPEFLRASGNPVSLHLLEHAEITRAALIEAAGGRDRPAFDVVVHGAEQTEVQRWSDARYHAHTEEHQPSARDLEIATGQEVFAGRVVAMLSDFVSHGQTGNFAMASLALGVACHAIQDLALHRGLTRRQLAGLQFRAGREASWLDAPSARREAQRLTRELLAAVRATGGEELWSRFLAWSPPSNFDAGHASKSLFRDEVPVPWLSYVSLTQHWASQLVYSGSPGKRRELDEGPAGLIRWDVPRLLERVRTGLAGSGIVARPTRRR